MVTGKATNSDDDEKLLLLAKLAEASARILCQIPGLDSSSNRYRVLSVIIDKLGEVAEELEVPR